MNNKYVNRAKISEAKFRELIRFFSLDLNAIQIAKITHLNRNTVNRYLKEIRKKIDTYCVSVSTFKRYNITAEKEGKNVSFILLIKETSGLIAADLYSRKGSHEIKKEQWIKLYGNSEYDLLIDMETGSHIYLSGAADGGDNRMQINRIESFWSSAKSRLAKFKGLQSSTIRYHVRECEFRFNNRDKDLYQHLLKIIRNNPLF